MKSEKTTKHEKWRIQQEQKRNQECNNSLKRENKERGKAALNGELQLGMVSLVYGSIAKSQTSRKMRFFEKQKRISKIVIQRFFRRKKLS